MKQAGKVTIVLRHSWHLEIFIGASAKYTLQYQRSTWEFYKISSKDAIFIFLNDINNNQGKTRETERVTRRLKRDGGTYCLACSLDAYVTFTTAVSLSVFTERKRDAACLFMGQKWIWSAQIIV